MLFDYRLMEALAMVVEEGGFERAAKRLHITQSAVSQRVKQLEELAGQILLIRSSPPSPTDAGMQIIRHLNKVQRLEADLQDDLKLGDPADFTSLPVGVNADSLATWFLEVVRPFLLAEKALLDLRVDDQDQTHRLLREGKVLGCVSAEPNPLQGCRTDYLGSMRYRLLATPSYIKRWFPEGLTKDAILTAPAVLFTRHDTLHQQILEQVLGKSTPVPPFNHYVPDYDRFAQMLMADVAYGTLTEQQATAPLVNGELVDLAPGITQEVHLYWHSWTIQSRLLQGLTAQIIKGAKSVLQQLV